MILSAHRDPLFYLLLRSMGSEVRVSRRAASLEWEVNITICEKQRLPCLSIHAEWPFASTPPTHPSGCPSIRRLPYGIPLPYTMQQISASSYGAHVRAKIESAVA